MTNRLLSCSRIVAVLIAALAAFLSASCSDQAAIYTVETTITEDHQVIRQPKLKAVSRVRQEATASGPRVQVDSHVHDFGRMDPLTVGHHVFLIRNVGNAPLKLEKGPTTCKCTLSSLQQHEVLPGEEARVVLTWNSGRDPTYLHEATVFTNDPRNKAVTLTVKGKVRVLFRCATKQLVLSRIDPDEAPTADILVYSQLWTDMHIDRITPPRDGIRWAVEPVAPAELETFAAQSGRRIKFFLPADIEPGFFSYPIHVHATDATGDDSPSHSGDCEFVVTGKKLRRIAFYGPTVSLTGTLQLGRLTTGRGKQTRILVKVRDPEKRIHLTGVTCQPSFLQVRLEPFKAERGEKIGLYYLHIDVPKEAPSFRLPPGQFGKLRLQFDHPRIDHVELPIDLIIGSAPVS